MIFFVMISVVSFLLYLNWRLDKVQQYMNVQRLRASSFASQAIDDGNYKTWDRFYTQYDQIFKQYNKMVLKFWVWPLTEFGEVGDEKR